MASFVSFFYNRGGSCPRSQVRNGGSWFTRRLAIFRVKPGIFDRMRACRNIGELMALCKVMRIPAAQFQKANRRLNRHFNDACQRAARVAARHAHQRATA